MSAAKEHMSAPSARSSAVMGTYNRQNLVFERGEGAWLIADNGDRYLDFTSGIAVNSLGHAHPALVEALNKQAANLWHTSNLYRVAGQEKLGERLAQATFADKVFFCNSGAEAVEGAIKTARRYHYVKAAEAVQGGTGGTEATANETAVEVAAASLDADKAEAGETPWRIITFNGAFHGRTLATISAAGNETYLEGFGEPVDGFDHVDFGDLAATEAAITPLTAAILVEPIQGEGGIKVASAEFLQGLRALCDSYGLLLIFDEVQSGVGRTGKFFAHEWAGITPDIMAIAKGIGGGFPLGAFMATDAACAGMRPGTHGTTFGGNPLAMAVGNAVLDVVLAPGFLDEVQQKALRLKQELARITDELPEVVEELRGQGLLMGLKLKANYAAGDAVLACAAEKFLTVGAGENVMRIIPPLNVTGDEISTAADRIVAALSSLRKPEGSDTEPAAGSPVTKS